MMATSTISAITAIQPTARKVPVPTVADDADGDAAGFSSAASPAFRLSLSLGPIVGSNGGSTCVNYGATETADVGGDMANGT
jgi:hypothetical protein